MKHIVQLTQSQIERFTYIAQTETTQEEYGEEWNPAEFSGGNFDDCYEAGATDANIESARFILDLFGIKY